MVKTSVITLKTKLCRPNHLHPEDSRRLKIVQNFAKVDVNKTAAFEDKMLEFNTKEDTVFCAHVTIAAVCAAGEEPQSWRDQEPRFPLPAGGSLDRSSKSRT